MSEQTCPETVIPDTDRRGRKALLAAGLAATVAAAGIGVPTVAAALSSKPTPEVIRPAAGDAGDLSLGSVSLDDLADELAALGLVIEISPADSGEAPVDSIPEGEVDEPDIDEPGSADDFADPFEGMTNEEIEALTEEEYSDILNAATESFGIAGDEIDTSEASSEVAQQARAIWGRFAELIPADQRGMVIGFELAGDPAGAYVYASDADPSKWILGVGVGQGAELDEVLIHEFGHLLTLQAKEVPPGGDAASCDTYFTGEGCALSGSTFADFVAMFWPQDMIDEINNIQETGDWDAFDAFYKNYRDHFVTDYASTNPAEDLAETFGEFVLNDRPGGNTIADQKVQFLWNDEAMVALRSQIRSNIAQ